MARGRGLRGFPENVLSRVMDGEDQRWMRRALEEARRGVGRTSPNPAVGAVIVKNGTELGAGWHRGAGLPHAEREAMAAVRERHGAEALRGADVYVSLEPCSTHGRTPPCTMGLIEAGVARVIYAAEDPNPSHAGRADRLLEEAGIQVVRNVLAEEARRLIRPFAKVQSSGLPWVILKTAMSLDGRITRPPGEGMWLSGPESRAEVQRIRAEVDAVMTSGETVRRDLPRLDLRDPELAVGRQQPWRVVLTRNPDLLPADAPLFTDTHRARTLVETRDHPEEVLRSLVKERGVSAVLVECGGKLAAVLLEAGLVDEWVGFLAPLLGGGPVPALAGSGLPEGLRLKDPLFQRFGQDIMLRAEIERAE
ncbi:MAG: bifunctional diaminohydroxyphosphoribosylaminopyrimidine deaminase/5-amino-6-(5-phosphoribosylamino)uracil reductase RibD [Verrucomicrobia bacterium]|nr:MAG: bifunctional diaminohydroxyphosphoribosylaminopyrimidine deaminase/5-amino-6-(5-phosphoribosylamino)uracil reductase RibD [Verrucomicrobiota bacterium]TAE88454.1 MAG: bifunctional diaminohydroxyphosphoribosylaminopyrimidine deaminase/5-amino-6-(5-phosphoribosylamino)uracil reductase RibD [Verrucomicrobiota bacterium]TAF26909.1 MAG: bifunctional diaminohydroxyphosphoribosylaminopyrimidine deaminase/5-amino-6-(5-phosphoribosylamino)uracil reductase RibD [Verrucomicrobiota bacterium]TAF4216